MKSFSLALKLSLSIALALAVADVQARQTISDFLLEVTPPGGDPEKAGYFGIQVGEGAVLTYDLEEGRVRFDSGDDVVPNAASDPDRIFFDRFQLRPQDRSGLYNPLFCFDLDGASKPVNIFASDINGHTVIEDFFPDEGLFYDISSEPLIGFQVPAKGACFYRSFDDVTNSYGEFGLFGDAQAASGGLDIQYNTLPESVEAGGTLEYDIVISNSSGSSLDVFFQEVFPANPDFFEFSSFMSDDEERGDEVITAESSFTLNVSRTVASEAVPGEYIDLYFGVAALNGSGNVISASKHHRVLVEAAPAP